MISIKLLPQELVALKEQYEGELAAKKEELDQVLERNASLNDSSLSFKDLKEALDLDISEDGLEDLAKHYKKRQLELEYRIYQIEQGLKRIVRARNKADKVAKIRLIEPEEPIEPFQKITPPPPISEAEVITLEAPKKHRGVVAKWAEIINELLNDVDRPLNNHQLVKVAYDAGKMSEEDYYKDKQAISKTLHTMTHKTKELERFKRGTMRGYYYGLPAWFDEEGNITEEYEAKTQ